MSTSGLHTKRGFEVKNKIKDIMWKYCALVRNRHGLEKGLDMIKKIKHDDIPRLCTGGASLVFNRGCVEAMEAIHMTDLSEMVIRSALIREETRKSHYRTDFPKRNNQLWFKNIIIKKEGDNSVFNATPPVITRLSPEEYKEVEK